MKHLTIPGGGAFGAFPAAVLDRVPPETLRKVGSVSGTSIGSLMALSIGLRKTEGLHAFFQQRVDQIFAGYFWRHYLSYPMPRYRDKALIAALREWFGDARLGDIEVPAWVVATHASGRPKVFFNRDVADSQVPIWEVCRASCAAPTYFQWWRGKADGGMCANNPAMVGLSGLIGDCGYTLNQVSVLKIGTGHAPLIDEEGNDLNNATGPLTIMGTVNFVRTALFEGAVDAMIDYEAETLLGQHRYKIVDFATGEDWNMDDPRTARRIVRHYDRHILQGAIDVVRFLEQV